MPPDPPDNVSLTRQGRTSNWLSQMLDGADETATDRRGRYLETPQRLGILPTIAFWKRRGVWKSARPIVAPVAGFAGVVACLIGTQIEGYWTSIAYVLPLALAAPLVTMGLLERYVREVLRRRVSAETPPKA